MADDVEVAWSRLAVLGGSALALVLLARGVGAAVGMAYDEFRYRAGDLDAWGRWLHVTPRGLPQRH